MAPPVRPAGVGRPFRPPAMGPNMDQGRPDHPRLSAYAIVLIVLKPQFDRLAILADTPLRSRAWRALDAPRAGHRRGTGETLEPHPSLAPRIRHRRNGNRAVPSLNSGLH